MLGELASENHVLLGGQRIVLYCELGKEYFVPASLSRRPLVGRWCGPRLQFLAVECHQQAVH